LCEAKKRYAPVSTASATPVARRVGSVEAFILHAALLAFKFLGEFYQTFWVFLSCCFVCDFPPGTLGYGIFGIHN
jgi:hypothetical protein